MAGESTAKPTAGIELTTISNAHLSATQIRGLKRRLIGMIVSIVALATIATVIKVISTIRWEAVTPRTIPFLLCMACRGTVSCDGIVYNTTQLDGARTVVQIMLIVAVAVLTCEALLLHMQRMNTCFRRIAVTVGTV